MRWRRLVDRAGDESGMVGGFEALPFGFLVFVLGTLLLAGAWGVVDAKLAASAAAREAARAYVESAGPEGAAPGDARAAAVAAIEGHGRDAGRMRLGWDEPLALQRCARATFEVTYAVPTIAIPLIGGFGAGVIDTTARHTEVVDPYRSGVALAPGEEAVRCG